MGLLACLPVCLSVCIQQDVFHEQFRVSSQLVVPHLMFADIRAIDFAKLRHCGIRAVVFDKDNCLTLPYAQHLHAPLEVYQYTALPVLSNPFPLFMQIYSDAPLQKY